MALTSDCHAQKGKTKKVDPNADQTGGRIWRNKRCAIKYTKFKSTIGKTINQNPKNTYHWETGENRNSGTTSDQQKQ